MRDEGATVIFSTHNMESVEALCDNFSLINRSHNILSGNVAEVRRRMGHNNYRLSFQGNPADLIAALDGKILSHTITEPVRDSGGVTYSGEFKLSPDTDMRQFLRSALDSVDLVSFDRALPSMNDIFIKAVEAANAGHPLE